MRVLIREPFLRDDRDTVRQDGNRLEPRGLPSSRLSLCQWYALARDPLQADLSFIVSLTGQSDYGTGPTHGVRLELLCLMREFSQK